MENQAVGVKIEALEKRDGIDKKSNLHKGSNATLESMYPSSSSYTTAEEGFQEDGPCVSNGNKLPNSSVAKSVSVDQLYSRIHHLEDKLAGKEAALLALTQELDAVREMSCIDASIGPLPSSFDSDFKASVDEYNRKLQEHVSALCQRDEMIEKLADSLKQSVRDREELKTEAERLTQQVHTLQSQLHSVGQHVQQPQTKLLEALKEKDAMLLKKSAELSQCKAQSSKEVQFLMSSLEEMQQQAARDASSSPPMSKCHDESDCKFAKELKDLRPSFDALNIQLKQLMSSKGNLEAELSVIQQKHHEDTKQLLSVQESLVQELASTKQKSLEQLNELTLSQELLEKKLLTVEQEHRTEVKELMFSKNHQEKELASLKQKHINEVNNVLSSQDDLCKELTFLKQKHSEEVKDLILSKDGLEKELASVKQKNCDEIKSLITVRDHFEKELVSVKQKHCEEVQELMSSKTSLEKELREVKQKHYDDSQSLIDQVAMLQNKLRSLNQSAEETAVEALINKCRSEVKFLHSLMKTVNPSLQGECDKSPSHYEKDNTSKTCLSGLTLLMSRLVSHCEDLENRNVQLKNNLVEEHAKLLEAERTLLLPKTTMNIAPFTEGSCACCEKYQEEINFLKSTIETLHKENLEKGLVCEEKVKSILKKSRSSNPSNVESEDNFVNLINEYSIKVKEIILLQNKLNQAQLECQMRTFEKEQQVNHLKDIQGVLEESLQTCCSLEETLQKTLKENSVLQARLKRLENVYEYRKQDMEVPTDLMWQLIDELAAMKAAQQPAELTKQQTNESSVADKIQCGLKIINKMNKDCESLLVKVASDDGNAAFQSYLQSEALGLRRLQTALLETEQTINRNSGPALQLHVDLLKQQLEGKKLLYENICEAHFSLEAEMREIEDQFKQREEDLHKVLSQQKLTSKLWQLKAQGLQMQVNALKVTEDPCEDRLLESFVQMDGAHSQVFSALRYEVEQVASQRESKVRLEMTEKILASERDHKQQLDKLSRHIQSGDSLEALQILHQQEIDAVRAECNYSSFKANHMMQEKLLSSLNHPPKVSPNDSCAEISLLLMKHSVASQYNVAFKKISSNLQNELVQKLDCLEVLIRNICSGPDQKPDFSLPDEKIEIINATEDLIQKAEDFGKKLIEMQKDGLETLLAVCEENNKLLLSEIQRVTAEFLNLSDVKHLQEKLLRCKEEHRLALESLTASHKAEVSRLRLLLSQQNASENSKCSETALTVLRKELEEKHKRQMEELRTYFEQKCADFEKHYSEEVFSQHSRKLSDCSSTSESELVSEMYYAGPGSSNCAATGAPSYFSDLLTDSSYKDLEEHPPAVDLDKLFGDGREQVETMRLALESRHQGELEAQKELYEVRVEELLRHMNESHSAEVKFQSKRLHELQEIEKMLNKKLLSAEEEIANLKTQLTNQNSGHGKEDEKTLVGNQSGFASPTECTRPSQEKTRLELEVELQKMSDILKRKDSESSAQIASLKVKLRENHEVMSKLEKDLSNLRSKHSSEIQILTASIDDKVRQIDELNLKVQELSSKLKESNALRVKLDAGVAHQFEKLKKDYESRFQKKDEECECKLNELHSELVAKNAGDLHTKTEGEEKILEERINSAVEEEKKLLDSEYAKYLDFVKKCADDTKIQLIRQHEKDMAQTVEKYELELAVLKNASKENCNKEALKTERQITGSLHRSLEDALKNERCVQESSLSNCLQDLFVLSSQLNQLQQDQLEKIIFKVCQEETHCKEKLHQELEMRLDFVQKECERRFNLQLEEARSDIVQALELQIQQLLDDNTDVTERPAELQQLEKKFASKYLEKLNKMQEDYESKISDLCKKHASQISHARSKPKVADDVIITAEELDKVCKERDCLRNVAATLRDVVAELVRYFMSWEDDFNNSLMDELAKFEAGKGDEILSVTQNEESACWEQSVCIEENNSSYDEMPVIVATPARGRLTSTSSKRVHFASNISGILSLIDDGSLLESVGLNFSMRDASLNFQEELDRCLARLRSDSAALYALSKPALLSSRQNCSHHASDDNHSEEVPAMLTDTLSSLEILQKENQDLRSQLEILHDNLKLTVVELETAQQRLSSLEQEARHQAEVVAEGYGEGEQSMTCDTPTSPRATSVEELQNKAKALLLGTRKSEEVSGVVSPTSGAHLPHIVEELCRDWERLAEESRHKQDDLQQQVDVADKQLKATRIFMDEQATERELERDEFVQEIKRLQESLRDKDRDRSSQQHMNHEVETLESQLKETQSALKDTQEKLEKLSAEHKQAVEKIWTLRDIISDLEVQVASKSEEAASAFAQNKALHQMVEQQGQTQLQLAQEMEELQMYADNRKLVEKISQLEEQLRRHQVLAEQLGDPSAVDQMITQLHDLSAAVELHTRELECAYASTALPPSPCLSSPSEDVSIRETLEAIRAASEKNEASKLPGSWPILPFNEVSQVMEQWQKHARADDAVLKKIRDLDMQLDDIQAEKHLLVANLQEQMLLASSLQAKLDEHRRKADVKLSEATAEMQGQIEDLRSEIHNHMETLEAREKQVQNLRSSLQQAENNLRGREAEIRRSAEAERTIASQLKSQVSKLTADKAKLQAMLSQKDAMHVSLPALVESMLLDKNADIDRLENQVHHLTKQMELSSYYVATPSTSLEFEYRESEQVRAHVALSPVLELQTSFIVSPINESTHDNTSVLQNDVSLSIQQLSLEKYGLDLGLETEDSLKPMPLEETVPPQTLSNNSNSASDTLSSLADTFNTSSLSSCERKVSALEEEIMKKNKIIEDCMQQLNGNALQIAELESKVKCLAECEQKLTHLLKLEDELKAVTLELKMTTESKNADKLEFEQICRTRDTEVQQLKERIDELLLDAPPRTSVIAEAPDLVATPSQEMFPSNELEDKESEIQRLKNEVCATQAILANLQKKVQEAKQIARSPSRSSPENHQVLRAVQSELEAAKKEIVELKDLCKSIRSEVESESQQKQTQFEKLLEQEQQTKLSLIKALEKVQTESTVFEFQKVEEELKRSKDTEIQRDMEIQKLQVELKQLNMECITLRQQLHTPISHATTLASRLDAEKKFADALKEELFLHKSRACTLDEECSTLRNQIADLQKVSSSAKNDLVLEEKQKLLGEVSELKSSIDTLKDNEGNYEERIEKLLRDNTLLQEENTEVAKELSDMKQLIIKLHGVRASLDETQVLLKSKVKALDETKTEKDQLKEELRSLRRALKNLHVNNHDYPELVDEDRKSLRNIQRQLCSPSLRGAGDGPSNKLVVTDPDIYEISPDGALLKESESLDDITDLVQHEVDVSVQLDHSLLQTINPSSSKKVGIISGNVQIQDTQKRTNQDLEGSNQCSTPTSSQTMRINNFNEARLYQLEMELNQMKVQYYELQQQDCELIQEMRLKLSEALDGQAALKLQLENERTKKQSSLVERNMDILSAKSLLLSPSVGADKLQTQLSEATSQVLKLQTEKDSMEKQLRRLQEVEVKRSHRRADTEQKYRRHIEQLQTLHNQTQQECSMLRQELAAVNQKLQLAQEEFVKDRNDQLKNHTPFVERLKKMNTFLEEHIEENQRMAKQMEDLTEEHRRLRCRIAQLEGQLAEKRSNESFETANARFAAERAEWEAEHKLLLLALREAKHKQFLCGDSDVEERISHLFGRYLRMQSYRKALVWQKRYLLSVISGINESKSLAASHLSGVAGNSKEKQPKSFPKFRSAVLVMIAIHRMKFMVERWLRGKRIGCGVVVQQTLSHTQFAFSSSISGQGQQQLFPSSHLLQPTDELRSGLCQSPPTLERPRQPRSHPTTSSQFSRVPLNSRGLGNTGSLSDCVSSFNLAQKHFDSLLSNPHK